MYRAPRFFIITIIVEIEDAIVEKWKQIYNDENSILFGYLVKKTGESAAQDILQESFLKLFETIKKGRTIENTRAYLFQIARNLLINEYKNKITSLPDFSLAQVSDQSPNLEESLEKKELMEILESSRSVLTEQEIEIFEFRWHFGLKQNDIALIMHKSERQIRRDLEKITQKIREYFKTRGWQAEHITGKD